MEEILDLLLQLLIVVLSLLPDYAHIIVRFIQETLRMSTYQDKQSVNTSLAFVNGGEPYSSPSSDCNLGRFEHINSIEIKTDNGLQTGKTSISDKQAQNEDRIKSTYLNKNSSSKEKPFSFGKLMFLEYKIILD